MSSGHEFSTKDSSVSEWASGNSRGSLCLWCARQCCYWCLMGRAQSCCFLYYKAGYSLTIQRPVTLNTSIERLLCRIVCIFLNSYLQASWFFYYILISKFSITCLKIPSDRKSQEWKQQFSLQHLPYCPHLRWPGPREPWLSWDWLCGVAGEVAAWDICISCRITGSSLDSFLFHLSVKPALPLRMH